MSTPHGTFSIVAADLETGEVGCAVQSKYFSVGSAVPWVKAGVGAVATQASVVAVYGRRGLEELENGAEPGEALTRMLAADEGRETRQLGIVTSDGRAAAFTGAECIDWAGHRIGSGFAVQGNILAGAAVVDDMVRAFEETVGSLAHRLVSALEAGQAAGGDTRGQQSAAVIVERAGGIPETHEGIDRICDLRVEDHAEPIVELRRLLGLWGEADAQRSAHAAYLRGDPAAAADTLVPFAENAHDAWVIYNLACYESLAGRHDAAVGHVRAAMAREPRVRELAATDADLDPIRVQLSL